MHKIEGIYTALVSPVKNEKIDQEALEKVIEHVLVNGSTGLVALGGTGEYCALSNEQRVDLVKATVRINRGRVPIVAGIIGPGLPGAIEMGNELYRHGVDALMLVTPYYVIPTQNGLVDYYLRFMDKVHAPLVLYNIPYRTNVNMQPETVMQLLEKDSRKQIVGIKECTPNLSQATYLQYLLQERISFVCGEEGLFFSELSLGAHGAILATSNLVPQVWNSMLTNIKNGRLSFAAEQNKHLAPLLKHIFSETNPGPLKAAMKLIGLDCGDALPPLMAPGEELRHNLEVELKALLNWFKNND